MCSCQPSSVTELGFEGCDDMLYFSLRISFFFCLERSQRFKSIFQVLGEYPWRAHKLQLEEHSYHSLYPSDYFEYKGINLHVLLG